MDKILIKIAIDFSKTPGVREEIEGDDPGEKFLSDVLLPRFKQALTEKRKLVIDMDDTAGYPTSFLEASFGGLVRLYDDKKIVLDTIEIIAQDDPFLMEDIMEYIDDALETK